MTLAVALVTVGYSADISTPTGNVAHRLIPIWSYISGAKRLNSPGEPHIGLVHTSKHPLGILETTSLTIFVQQPPFLHLHLAMLYSFLYSFLLYYMF